MNAITEKIFRCKKVLTHKLIEYGFEQAEGGYVYVEKYPEADMTFTVIITCDGNVEAMATDNATGEPYTLFLAEGAAGEFVGKVRTAYESLLNGIASACCEREVFKSADAHKILEYVSRKYGSQPEYLWDKFPYNAVLRRKDNAKWFCVLLTVAKSKIGMAGEGTVEIIDVRMKPEEAERMVDGATYFKGYHMNKKHWVTIPLNCGTNINEIFKRIDDSYILAKK